MAQADILPMAPSAILAEADEARGNLAGVQWVLRLRAHSSKSEESMTLDVKARGFDVVSVTLEPARSQGNRLLLLKENVWFDKPGLSKPVPISKRQKLLGEAAYGDIATTDYAGDYAPTLLGTETVGGRECWVFDLKAKSNEVTYDRIKYWVDQQSLTGVQAEYFTLSGKRFKSAKMEYDNRVRRDGSLKPFISKITIFNEIVKSQQTTLTFSDPELRALPDHMFRVSSMQ